MTFVITQGCCNDASCIAVCPVQCIRPRPGDPDFTTAEQLYIDPSTCIDCGACQDECPVSAIHPEWDLPESDEEFLAINADYFVARPIEASALPDPVRRKLPEGRETLSVAIVGTGPAGCYAAAELSDIRGVEVSLFDRLPTPFGLVRAGVAPDHGNTKQITKRFGALLNRPNVRTYLNVHVGRDVSIDDLLAHHHAVIWATGASSDRTLGIPGEELPGSLAAREVVAWYNGHPDHHGLEVDLSAKRVVVIGNGNVAIDVARMLSQPVGALEGTETADHALESLRRSCVEEVVVTARRGPEFAAYTTAELIGLQHVEGIHLEVVGDDVARTSGEGVQVPRLPDAVPARPSLPGDRRVTFRYGLVPVSINGHDAVQSVTFRNTEGELEDIEAGLVVRAIGFRAEPVDGLPFDAQAAVLPNVAGAVVDPDTGQTVPGVYCSGWIKRGPTGVIGTNKVDSAETVDTLLADFAAGRLADPAHDLDEFRSFLSVKVPDALTAEGWQRIDQAERKAGRRGRRPRQKLVTMEALLAAARGAS